MALLPILIAPDPRLKRKAQPVTAVDDRVRRLMADMLETMYHANGIGLAAPQVGVLERVIVIDTAVKDQPAAPLCLANPEVVWSSEALFTYNEGCLSFPEIYADVSRAGSVRVRYIGRNGERSEIEADGVLAVCLQHEIDHLEGVLFVDRISMLRRNMILRRMQKSKRTGTFG